MSLSLVALLLGCWVRVNEGALNATLVAESMQWYKNMLSSREVESVLEQRSERDGSSWCGTHYVHESKSEPLFDVEHTHLHKRFLTLPSSSCMESKCDVPEINAGYVSALKENRLKDTAITLKVIAFAMTNGMAPHVDKRSTESQINILNQGYLPVGLFFVPQTTIINDDKRWSKKVVAESGRGSNFNRCRNVVGGNKKCDKACDFEEFGWDSGDCLCADQSNCQTSNDACRCLRGAAGTSATPAYCNGAAATNGVCDVICNLVAFEWDHGECCQANSPFCFDGKYSVDEEPSSFVSIDAYLQSANAKDVTTLTVVVAPFARSEQTLGIGALPQRAATTVPIGVLLVNAARNGWGVHVNDTGQEVPRYGVTAVHEIGHIFGLLHTHQGYDASGGKVKKDLCQSGCIETAPSATQGDFCSDTPPTPDNRRCEQPLPCSGTTSGLWCSNCAGRAWRDTNFINFMGYAPDQCIFEGAFKAFAARGNNSLSTGEQVKVLEFGGNTATYMSVQQAARIRCFFDAHYVGSWFKQAEPSIVPGTPLATPSAAMQGGIIVEWMHPVFIGNNDVNALIFLIERSPPFANGVVRVDSKSPASTYAEDQSNLTSASLRFSYYVDLTASEASLFRYRVKTRGLDNAEAFAWSAWSEPTMGGRGFGCAGNCHGHGRCVAANVCACNSGWSKRDKFCRIEDECAGAAGSGCVVSEVGDGVCHEACLACSGTGPSNRSEVDDCMMAADASDCDSAKCDMALWGNGRCDQACNSVECMYDFGDCAGCSATCPLAWKGDGVCDSECNTAGACDFDGGDCEKTACNQRTPATANSPPCRRSFIGDGSCDQVCNVLECDFDNGDCGQCAPGCKSSMIGNGICDEACRGVDSQQRPLCTLPGFEMELDGGDCLSCAPQCVLSQISDGACDQVCNNANCQFDGYDCLGCPCGSTLLKNGVCDQQCNRAECKFDNMDCMSAQDRFKSIIAPVTPVNWLYIGVGVIAFVLIVVVIVVIVTVRCYRKRLAAANAHSGPGHSIELRQTSPSPSSSAPSSATNSAIY